MGIGRLINKIQRNENLKNEFYEKYDSLLAVYNKFSFSSNKCIDEKQYEAVITRWYHTIEKGLAYVDYRPGFGKKNIENLVTAMENYVNDGYSVDVFFFETALCTLYMYIEKNRKCGIEDKELEKRIEAMGGKANTYGGALMFEPLSKTDVQALGYADFVCSRHSMRHFSKQTVEIDDVMEALNIAQHTPSACNRQGWKARIIMNKMVMTEVLKNQNGNEGFGHEFDKLMLITADIRCFNRDRELFQAYIDGGMYAQSVLNALHYEHIASVPLSASLTHIQEKEVRKLLNLHEAEVLIMFIGIGNYPDVCQTTQSVRHTPCCEII